MSTLKVATAPFMREFQRACDALLFSKPDEILGRKIRALAIKNNGLCGGAYEMFFHKAEQYSPPGMNPREVPKLHHVNHLHKSLWAEFESLQEEYHQYLDHDKPAIAGYIGLVVSHPNARDWRGMLPSSLEPVLTSVTASYGVELPDDGNETVEYYKQFIASNQHDYDRLRQRLMTNLLL